MTFTFISDIISNFWFFQTESVVPIFQEWSTIMILILFIIPFVLAFVIDQVLHKSKFHIVIGLILYPILIVAFTWLLSNFGYIFGFSSIDFNLLINTAIKYWWVFVLFWPVVGFRLIMKLFIKEENADKIIGSVPVPIFEELAFRLLAINTIFLITKSIEISLILSTIAFSLIHLPNKSGDRWGGPVKINATLVMGFFWGIIAIKYGLIFSTIAHIIQNIFGVFIMPKILKE
jgi:hypothetical protein